jgi:hypothetical protein
MAFSSARRIQRAAALVKLARPAVLQGSRALWSEKAGVREEGVTVILIILYNQCNNNVDAVSNSRLQIKCISFILSEI